MSTTLVSARTLALASLVLLSACATKNADPTPTATTGFSWTVDNTNYVSTTSDAVDTGLTITVSGTYASASGKNIIRLAVPAAIGTFSTNVPTYPAYYYMAYLVSSTGSGSVATAYVASNAAGAAVGTVTVTTLSATEIAGTFSFTGELISGTATKVITNGKFNVNR